MAAEWVTAAASIFTSVVIAATAFAALFQLRRMRESNQIAALTECRGTVESREFQEAQRFLSTVLPERLRDVDEAERVVSMNPFVGDYQAIATVGNFFESMGIFVKNGIIDKRIACDAWSFVIVRNWEALAPVIEVVRRRKAPTAYVYFEYLTTLAAKHLEKYPVTNRLERFRMPKDTSLVERLDSGRKPSI